MATAPVADQQALLALQALDTKGQQLVHQRRNLPEHAKIAELDAELAELERALVDSRTQAADLREELAKAERDVAQVRDRAKRDQGLLDAGSVGAKDAQALVAEIESLSNRQSVLEEVELDVMERLEAHESTLGDMEEAFAKTSQARADLVAARDRALVTIDEQRKQLIQARRDAASKIDDGLLATYERLREQLGGLAAAKLEGSRCGGCRMEINAVELAKITAAAPETVVRCDECGRLLIRPTT
ncbi:hypothetical protein SAMN06309944_0385 [Micrococcales bacterium KH10]|nr:hypothetical protein SAMN06309944_0385 [Micrococcales bacterium KH10]